jgi:large subunit ribosomal protein L9
MKVFLLKDVEKVGLSGEIVKAKEGFALNYLIPKKLAIIVTPGNEGSFKKRVKVVEHRKEVVATKTSMLAEKIKSLKLTLKRKMHDEEKLYGSIGFSDIVDLLAIEGIKVAKNQVLLDKQIKSTGTYDITIKLSNQLQPKFTLKVVPE